MSKLSKSLFVLSSLFLLSHQAIANNPKGKYYSEYTADGKEIVYTTTIDGQKYTLRTNSGQPSQHDKTLQLLKQAMVENNRLTAQYLKTKSPAWKDLMTDEMKANVIKFDNAWKRIVIERHYNKDVLNAYEKYKAAELANWDKMYAHFYSLSTNEPFKIKVREGQQTDKNHFINKKEVIKHLRTYL